MQLSSGPGDIKWSPSSRQCLVGASGDGQKAKEVKREFAKNAFIDELVPM